MWLLVVVMVLLAGRDLRTNGIMLYGPCPHLLPNTFEEFQIQPFFGSGGEILYFSNVRFEALFDERQEVEERYRSFYFVTLEQQEDCFRPFQLESKASLMEIPLGSARRGPLTMISTVVLAVHEKSHLLAFSCVQIGHNKLEYVWVFGRTGRFGVGLERVRQMFDPWLANISTSYQDLRRSHHEIPFCRSILWTAVVYGVVGLLAALALTTGIVCWKKHKQILQLRRSSCAEFPMEELEMREDPRDVTSAKTIAVMSGVVI